MKKVDSAIIIFVFSSFGYTSTYLFQWGFLSFYNLPHTLIDINISVIIRNILIITGVSLSGIIVHYFFVETNIGRVKFIKEIFNDNELKHKAESYITQLVVIVLMFIFMILFYKYKSYVFLVLAFICALNYLIIKNYKTLALMFLIITIMVLIFNFGYSFAQYKTQYFIIKDTDLLVIHQSQDKAIVAKYDEDKSIIYPEYQFISLESSELGEIQLKYKEIKDLKIVK